MLPLQDDLMPQEAMLQDAPAAAGALLEHVARLVEQHVDLQRLLACAKPLQPAQPQLQPAAPFSQRRTRIAVAQDAAFCFYYRE
jgi:cobyrinic acid a,c-diamide synthase